MPELNSSKLQQESLRAVELRQRLEAFASEYLVQKGSSSSTIGTYKRSVKEFVRWVEEANDGVAVMAKQTVTDYALYLTEIRKLAPASVPTYLRALKHFCDYLLKYKLIRQNPVDGISLEPRPSANPRAILTRSEADKLMRVFNPSTEIGARDHALVACMLFGGLNEVQLMQANIEHLDINLWEWSLQVALTGGRGLSRIELDESAATALEQYLDIRRGKKMKDPIFVSHGNRGTGRRLTTRTVRNRITEALSSAGIARPGVKPSSLKLTAVLLWIQNGFSKEAILNRVTENTLRSRLALYSDLGLSTGGISV